MIKVVNHRKEFIEKIQQEGINEGKKQGRIIGLKIGMKIGEINLARKIAKKIGVEETAKLTGISKEKIENENWNNFNLLNEDELFFFIENQ